MLDKSYGDKTMPIEYEVSRNDSPNYIYHENQKNHDALVHFHSCFEYMYCSSGALKVMVDGKDFMMYEGDAVLIFPYQIHANTTVDHSEDYVCVFSSSYIYSFYETHKSIVAQSPVFPFKQYAKQVNEGLQDPNGNRYQKKAFFYLILSEFVKHTEFHSKNTSGNNLLVRILEYIYENWTDDITLKDIAKHLHASYTYLSLLFNNTFKTNFSRFLNEYRISNAQAQLLNPSSDKNLSEIASSCGYSSIRSFNRNFLAITGVTPTDFKNLHSQPIITG